MGARDRNRDLRSLQMLTRSPQTLLPWLLSTSPGSPRSRPGSGRLPSWSDTPPARQPQYSRTGQGSAHAEIFVVGVREDAQYARRALAGSAHRDVVRHRVQLIAPPPAAMASAICPKSYLTAAST